jgi:hypothetical protein
MDSSVDLRKAPLGKVEGLCSKGARDHQVIVVNSDRTLLASIFTLGHETVHVKQYLTGQLREDQGGILWQGKHYYPHWMASNPANYLRLPWEAEAFAKQDYLYRLAVRSLSRDHCVDLVHDFIREVA